MLEDKIIICWNYRGVSSGNFMREMKELSRAYRTTIVVLLEPKISGVVVDGACKRIGMNLWGHLEATDFSDGIWVLWNEDEIMIEVKHVHKFFMHVAITLLEGRKWELTTIYSS